MAEKKTPIDWAAIKADWEKSDKSIRWLADWYQVSEAGIRKRAKQEAWPDRPQPTPVPVRTSAEPRVQPVIMAGVDATEPTQIVSRGRNLIFRLLDELDAATTHQGELAEMIEAHEEDPRRRAAMLKAVDLQGRSNVIKALATAFKTWGEANAPEGKKAQKQQAAEGVASPGGKFAPRSAPRMQ